LILASTTEIWNNNQSRPHVRLPEAMTGHCLTSLNRTHVLLTGGQRELGVASAASFIYNEQEGFTRIEDMRTARRYHGCSVINESTVLVAGGSSNLGDGALSSTEYLDLTSLTWYPGARLPKSVSPVQILGPEVLGPQIGGHLLIDGCNLFKLEEDGLAQTRHWTQSIDCQSFGAEEEAFVVNQNLFC